MSESHPTPAVAEELNALFTAQQAHEQAADHALTQARQGVDYVHTAAQKQVDAGEIVPEHDFAIENGNKYAAQRFTEADKTKAASDAFATHLESRGFKTPSQKKEETHNSDARQARIRELDESAHLALFGSGKNTIVDPATGAVIADPSKPFPGKIADMLAEPVGMNGRPQKERDAAAKLRQKEADAYKADLLGLVNDEDFSIAQAKLVMDLRGKDAGKQKELANKLAAELKQRGVASKAAEKQAATKAAEVYSKADAKRRQLIKSENLYSEDEYSAHLGRTSQKKDPKQEAKKAANRLEQVSNDPAVMKAANAYVELSAAMRNGHLGRISGGRLRNLLAGISWNKSEKADAAVEAARKEYLAQFNTAAANLRAQLAAEGMPADQIRGQLKNLKVDELTFLERDILARRQASTHNRGLAALKSQVAEDWSRSNRFGKILIVAAPAAAIGITGGLAAAAFGLGVIGSTVAGAGVAYAGRKTGHVSAGVANKGLAATQAGAQRTQTTVDGLRQHFANLPSADNEDHTRWVEHATTEQVHANQRRRRLAGTVGTIAASGSFGVTRLVAHGLDIHGLHIGGNSAHDAHNAAGGSAHNPAGVNGDPIQPHPQLLHPTAHGASGAHGAHGAVQPNVHQYPWQVAHQLAPHHEMAAIQHAMNASNATTGSHLRFANVGNTVQVYNGSHALNAAQQAAFNTFMNTHV